MTIAIGEKSAPDSFPFKTTQEVAKTLFGINIKLGIEDPIINYDSDEMDISGWGYEKRRAMKAMASASTDEERERARRQIDHAELMHRDCLLSLRAAETQWKDGTFGITTPATTWRKACFDALAAVFVGLEWRYNTSGGIVYADFDSTAEFLTRLREVLNKYYHYGQRAKDAAYIKQILKNKIIFAKKRTIQAPYRASVGS